MRTSNDYWSVIFEILNNRMDKIQAGKNQWDRYGIARRVAVGVARELKVKLTEKNISFIVAYTVNKSYV